MSRIEALIQELCPDGVEHNTLGQVGKFIRGNGLQKADLRDEGVPAVHYGQIHTVYGVYATETKSFTDPDIAAKLRHARPGDLLVATTSEDDDAVAKATVWLGDTDVVLSGDAYIYRHELEPKFVAYFFQSTSFQNQKRRFISGTKVRRLSGASLEKIRIPVPPLEVQREIVRILDRFTQLEVELEAEQEARHAQYEHYRVKLLTPSQSATWSTLGGVSTRVTSGATPKAGDARFYECGTIPWLRTGEVKFGEIWETDVQITDQALAETAVKWIPGNCVIVAISGATAARSAINKIPLTTNQHCCNLEIDPAVADYRYVFYWVSSKYEELKSLGRGARADLNSKLIKDFQIPVPDLDEQRRIVEGLEDFDALVNDISIGLPAELTARRKQYVHYRDRLLSFKELTA